MLYDMSSFCATMDLRGGIVLYKKIKEKKLIVKHNRLIEYRGKMTPGELKLFSLIVTDVRENQVTQFEKYRVDVSVLKEATQDKNFYGYIKDLALKLEDKKIVVEENTGKGNRKTTSIRLINKPTIVEDSYELELFIDKDLVPYIANFKKEFTRYEIENVLRMRSSYSIRIYELIKQHENMTRDYRDFKVKELREYLGIEENEYPRFYDFEKRALKPAVEEINEFTDIKVNYEKLKKSGRVVGIRFNAAYAAKEYVKYLEENYNIPQLKEKMGLAREKFNARQIMDLYEIAINKTQDEVDVFKYIEMNHFYMIKNSRARNKFAYLKKALEEDYAKAFVQLKYNYFA